MTVRMIVATRLSETEFFSGTHTGRSLKVHRPDFVQVQLFPSNKVGLPTLYNRAIEYARSHPATLVFAHDDLILTDCFWYNRIKEGLGTFDILGLAGNKRRVPGQPSWAFVNDQFVWDDRENLSGIVGHGNQYPPRNLSNYGPPRQPVKLLDGLLLAAESETLIKSNTYFDERFDFHFYDLDFCRTAEVNNLSCGTWDISLIHDSKGDYASESWRAGYRKYLDKWGS